MKKYGSLIALLVVVILAVLVFATREKPVEKVSTPYSVAQVEKLARIELTQPGEKGGLVVLSFGEAGWTLTKPVESALADRVSDQIAGAFEQKINTDDVKLDPAKLADFGLDDEAAPKVALFAEGSEVPATEFWLGKTFAVEGTRAKRTYIKTSDGKIFRAQTDLGDIIGRPIAELRSKTVLKMDRNALDNIWVKYQDESKNIHMVKKTGDTWALEEPAVAFELERNATSAIVNSMANLVATGFADDKPLSEIGLEPPFIRVIARETSGEPKTLLVSQAKDGKAYAKLERSPHIYEIAENTAAQLAATPLTLRARLVKNIGVDDVTRVDFGGPKVSVQRADDGWTFARGAKGKVKESALTPKLTAIAQLRAVRFETPTLAEAGLAKPADTLVITTKDGTKHTLLIGGDADSKGNVWAKWADIDLVMVVPQWIKERGAPTADELKADES